MRIGRAGLGRMGANMARGRAAGGHAVQRGTNDHRAMGSG
jgi:6-phosphogluconate dehydrogenase (decarboxylating)